MDPVRTYTCAHCGASLATSAPPGTTVNCEYCGTPFRVPAPAEETPPYNRQPDRPAGAQASVAQGAPRRGDPSPMPPVPPGGEPPGTPETPPDPASPAGVGHTVDTEAVAPTVGREGQITPEREIQPIPRGDGQAPTAADLIAEPTKYGAAVPAEEGEVVVVPPNRVTVIPPQVEGAGPPGKALRSRSPLMLLGVLLACCLITAAVTALCVLTSALPNLFSR